MMRERFRKVLIGDCRETLRSIEPNSVHCCVTSPPYWGLRDYGDPGQIGCEPDIVSYVDALVRVFRLVRLALRNDGVLFVNLGDTFARNPAKGGSGPNGKNKAEWGYAGKARQGLGGPGIRESELCGVPWSFADAMRNSGWFLRDCIVWSKPNPLPSSQNGVRWVKCCGDAVAKCNNCFTTDGLVLRNGSFRTTTSHEYVFMFTSSHRYFCDAERARERDESGDRIPRSVWSIDPEPYSGDHFAVFPSGLPKRCIEMATSAGGTCGSCGAQYAPIVQRNDNETTTVLGYRQRCRCEASVSVPPIVLDPFGGSGTTAQAAQALGCDWIMCELSMRYVDMSKINTRPAWARGFERVQSAKPCPGQRELF